MKTDIDIIAEQCAAIDRRNGRDTLFRCTVCGQIGTVGRCCGRDTREPLNDLARDETSLPNIRKTLETNMAEDTDDSAFLSALEKIVAANAKVDAPSGAAAERR